MFYLFIGYVLVGIFLLAKIPLWAHLDSDDLVLLLVVLVVFDAINVAPYLLGRLFSKTQALHRTTLLLFGVITGVIWSIAIPSLELTEPGAFPFSLGALLTFFLIAFIPPKVEFWRQNKSVSES